VKEAKNGKVKPAAVARATRGSGSPLADQPLPVPSTPPPGPASAKPKRASQPATTSAEVEPVAATSSPPAGAPTKSVNALMPFLEFVEQHPVGTSCTVVVESYASHGAYARAGDVLVYLPLRLMGNPVPRSARSAVSIGDALAVVIAGYTPERRSIDAALPSAAEGLVASGALPAAPAPARVRKRAESPAAPTDRPSADKPSRPKRVRKPAAVAEPIVEPVVEPVVEAPVPAAVPSRRGKKAAAPVDPAVKKAARSSKKAVEPAPAAPAAPAAPETPPAPSKRTAKKSVQQPAPSPEPAKPVKKAAGRARAAKKAAS